MKPSVDYEYYSDFIVDNDVTLYYDKENNCMVDCDGIPVHNIFKIITPNVLYMFKQKKQDMFIYGVDGQPVELLYPDLDYS